MSVCVCCGARERDAPQQSYGGILQDEWNSSARESTTVRRLWCHCAHLQLRILLGDDNIRAKHIRSLCTHVVVMLVKEYQSHPIVTSQHSNLVRVLSEYTASGYYTTVIMSYSNTSRYRTCNVKSTQSTKVPDQGPHHPSIDVCVGHLLNQVIP